LLLPERQYEIIAKTIEDKGKIDAAVLAGKLGIRISDIMRDLAELESRNLVKIEKKVVQKASLTAEAHRYIDKGFPEERLLKKLVELGEISISELREKAGDFDLSLEEVQIAIQHLIRLKAVEIKTGKIRLIISKDDLEKTLKKLEESRKKLSELEDKIIDDPKPIREYLRRGLVKLKKRSLISIITPDTTIELYRKGELKPATVVTVVTPELIVTGKWRNVIFKKFDLKVEPPTVYPYRKHPYMELLDEIREILEVMGFEEMKGPHVELELWNFDALFQAQDHPAREIHDTFFLKYPKWGKFTDKLLMEKIGKTHENGWITGSKGWRYKWDPKRALRLILRTQTTAVSMRTIYGRGDGEYRCFSLDRVFRPETLDPKHAMEFYQLEGIIVGEKITFKHLLGFFQEFAKRLGLGKVKIKPGYFPFTEPSVEGFIKHPELGWIEVFPGGMFRPEVLRPLGVEKSNVAAWGIGIDRIAMTILGISDIRDLFSPDLEFLRSRRVPIIESIYR